MKVNSYNLITSSNKCEQELATLNKIKTDFIEGKYNNTFILITNYLGHVPHYSEHGELVFKLLSNMTWSIENNNPKHFISFVEHLIHDVEWLQKGD